MQTLYFVLAAFHLVAVCMTGIVWTLLDVIPPPRLAALRQYERDNRAVHFGSLYLIPSFLGLAYAFQRLQVPAWHQLFFPAGLLLLVVLAGVAYLLPKPEGVDRFYYWTKGWPMVISLSGLACLVVGLTWTATVLVVYAMVP